MQTMLRGAARNWLEINVDVRPAIESLDGLVAAREDAIATFLVADVDPVTGLALVVNAGHPPPLVVDHTGRAAFVRGATNPALGLGAPHPMLVHATMTPGSTLVLYTDGLVDRRSLPLAAGFARLRAAATGCHTVPVERLAEWLLAASLAAGPAEDDATVVVARVTH
jgi:serine phosphatase RsbU (regulator of sigma subunit)